MHRITPILDNGTLPCTEGLDCGGEGGHLTGASPLLPDLLLKLSFLSLISVLSTLVNVILIYLSYKTKSLVSNTKLFVISLSASHMLGSVVFIPIWVITRVLPEVASKPPFCDVASFVWFLMLLSSFYSLSAISLDRYFIISHPMRYPIEATTKRKTVALALIWAWCVLFALAPTLGWGRYEFQAGNVPMCGLNWKHSLSFSVIFILLGCLVPVFVDVVTCGRILRIARRQSREIETRKGSFTSTASSICSSESANSQTTGRKLKHRLHTLRFIFAGTGCFLVCWLPYLVSNMWLVFCGIKSGIGTMPYMLEFSVMVVALLNGLINPIVTMATHRDYKRRLKRFLYDRFGVFKDWAMEERSDIDSSLGRKPDMKTLQHLFQKIGDIRVEGLGPKSPPSILTSTEVIPLSPGHIQLLDKQPQRKETSHPTADTNTNHTRSMVVVDMPGLVIK